MGHSAGAQLAMRIAADPNWLKETGGSVEPLSAASSPSAAPATTWRIGHRVSRRQQESGRLPAALWRQCEGDRRSGNARVASRGIGATVSRCAGSARLVGHGRTGLLVDSAPGRLADERLKQLGLSKGLVLVPRPISSVSCCD